MKTYNFKLQDKQRGTVSFTDSGVEVNFLDPVDQIHFMKEVELFKPTSIEDLVRSGYSMWDVSEVGDNK